MTQRLSRRFLAISSLLLGSSLLATAPSYAQTNGTSQSVTWNCTSSPCPWGATDSGQALVWPANAISTRLGYTTSSAVYLPSNVANGTVIEVLSGSASAYAGQPSANSHYQLAAISAGGTYTVSGVPAGEVVSLQGGSTFSYRITFAAPPANPIPESQWITWTCTGYPCPWGPTDSGYALVWPQAAGATSTRHGYTTSSPIYLPTNVSNGTVIEILSGSAGAYAGQPGASSHRQLATIFAGGTYQVSGVAANEVLSVQSGSFFTYRVTVAPPSNPNNPGPTQPVSQLTTWSCTSSPCPWGSTASGHALVWPAAPGPGNSRLGYTTSAAIYLPATYANGTVISITDGVASLYVGTPAASSHHLLATINPGQTYQVSGLTAGQVLSVQSSAEFKYQITVPQVPSTPPVDDSITSVGAYWRCNTPGCTSPAWVAQVIDWPSWAAYSSNNRPGDNSRTVYSAEDEVLHPYMGAWANGCEVTAVTGTVLIIEWQRGANVWRETFLEPGEKHTISLTSPENGAMIETYDYGPEFSVKLKNCTPQPVP